jgi:hypothetical protein
MANKTVDPKTLKAGQKVWLECNEDVVPAVVVERFTSEVMPQWGEGTRFRIGRGQSARKRSVFDKDAQFFQNGTRPVVVCIFDGSSI